MVKPWTHRLELETNSLHTSMYTYDWSVIVGSKRIFCQMKGPTRNRTGVARMSYITGCDVDQNRK